VKTVIDKNATASVSASVMRNTHKSVMPTRTKTRKRGTTTQNATLLARASCSSLYSWAIAGGGGSTPESGSVTSRRPLNAGSRISSRNSARNGSAGRIPFWRVCGQLCS
jgi:hypothetical protein